MLGYMSSVQVKHVCLLFKEFTSIKETIYHTLHNNLCPLSNLILNHYARIRPSCLVSGKTRDEALLLLLQKPHSQPQQQIPAMTSSASVFLLRA